MPKGKGYGGKFMDNGVGVYSYPKNPMKNAKMTKTECGPGGNSDQMKANKLLQKAQKQEDSLRGMSGM